MKDMNLTANALSMNHVLRAYAVKGDTAGVEKALTSYLDGFVLNTQSINSILTLILNSSGKLNWDKFVEIHSTYFDSGNLLRNEDTYRLLFTAARRRYGTTNFWRTIASQLVRLSEAHFAVPSVTKSSIDTPSN
jgi:hypothetical protein